MGKVDFLLSPRLSPWGGGVPRMVGGGPSLGDASLPCPRFSLLGEMSRKGRGPFFRGALSFALRLGCLEEWIRGGT